MGRTRPDFQKRQARQVANDKKRELAMPLLQKLMLNIEPNDANSRLEVGLHYLSFEDYASASQWLLDSANLGSREAMFFLGRLQLEQKSEARWLISAAELGDPDAAMMIAKHFAKTGDLERAVFWFEWLIERGEATVLENYFDALTKQGNTERVWPIISSPKNDASRFLSYAHKALLSRSCSLNLIEAVLGDPRSQELAKDAGFLFLIGQAYNGIGDSKAATSWFQRSHEAGSDFAGAWLSLRPRR